MGFWKKPSIAHGFLKKAHQFYILSVQWCPPRASLPSCAQDACCDFPILLTLLKSVGCPELVGKSSLKLEPLHWDLCASSETLVLPLAASGCLRCTSWIRVCRKLTEAEKLLNPSQYIISFLFHQLASSDSLWRLKFTSVSSDLFSNIASFLSNVTRSCLHLADISVQALSLPAYWTVKCSSNLQCQGDLPLDNERRWLTSRTNFTTTPLELPLSPEVKWQRST